jgi:uncharacterized protein YjbI with pentapeptide repeats
MDFKFVGKFVLTARELLVWNLRDQPEQINVVEKPLTLDTGTDRISFSGAGDTHFTVWRAAEDPAWGATSSTRFILRAGNGLYLTEQNGVLRANAQTRPEALVFQKQPEDNSRTIEQMCGAPLMTHDHPRVLAMNIADNATFAAQLLERFDLPDIGAVRQKYTGIRFADITPSLQQIRQAKGPVDLSWLYWPDVSLNDCKLPNSNLRGVVLSGAELRNIHLENSDLSDADFSRTDLRQANLSGAQVAGTFFSQTNLSLSNVTAVDFRKANVARATFMGANLKGANFASSNLKNTVFASYKEMNSPPMGATIFEGTDFSSTILSNDLFRADFWIDLPDSFGDCDFARPFGESSKFSTNPNNLTKFRQATLPFNLIKLNWSCLDLTGAKIIGLPQDLTGLQASNLTAQKINLSNHILKNAVFDNADLTNAEFTDADLTGASFKGAKLAGATFSFATLDQARFNGAQLGKTEKVRGAVLSYASMRGAIFTDANLDECQLDSVQWYPDDKGIQGMADNARCQNAKFTDANLAGINLSGATLIGAAFERANLIGADLSGAHAVEAAFTRAHLQGVLFARAELNGANFTSAAVALNNGVPLFKLTSPDFDTAGYIRDLNRQILSTDLRSAFTRKGYELLQHPAASKDDPSVSKDGSSWTVSNCKTSPPAPTGVAGNYSKFKIIDTKGVLQVFGFWGMWCEQLKDGHPQTNEVTFDVTALSKDNILSEQTVFPNSHNLNDLGTYTWEELMTAQIPLPPPACVADGLDWSCKRPPDPRTGR